MLLFIPKLLVLLYLAGVSLSLGPSLEDLAKKNCPTLRPAICLPYGLCCRFSEFCYAGLCESCFFDEVKVDLLGWCRNHGQHNVSLMRSSGCRLACQDLFTTQELAVINETIIYLEKDVSSGKLQDYTENKQDYFGYLVAVLVLLIVLILIVTLTKVWKHLPLQIRSKFSKLPKSDTYTTDIESSSTGSSTRSSLHSKKCDKIISTNGKTQALEHDPGSRKKDGHDETMVPQTISDKKYKDSNILAAETGSSKIKSREQNFTQKESRDKNEHECIVVHHTDTSKTLQKRNGLKKNNPALLAPRKKNENDNQADNEMDDEDINSSNVPLIDCANKDKGTQLIVSLPPSPSPQPRKKSHVSDDNYSNPLSSDNISSCIKEPEATNSHVKKDVFPIYSDKFMQNIPLQAEGGSQKSDEEFGATGVSQEKDISLSSSQADIYHEIDVPLNDKQGAKECMPDYQITSRNKSPTKLGLGEKLRDYPK